MKLRSYRVTPLGAILVASLAIAVGLGVFGPTSVQAPALAAAALLALVVLGGGFSGGWGGFSTKSLSDRQREFGSQTPRFSEAVDPSVEAEAWAKERERRRAAGSADSLDVGLND